MSKNQKNAFILSLTALKIFFQNVFKKLFYQPSVADIALIKETHLFPTMKNDAFNLMLRHIIWVKYQEAKLIIREGEEGDTLYIILDGSVRVFTRNARGEKVALARLNRGDYFGEQALLGGAHKTRNASIEAITDTVLLKIKEEFIAPLFQIDPSLRVKLKKRGREQAIKILSLAAIVYSDATSALSQIDKSHVIELKDNDVVFNQGDKSDNVFIIIQGNIKLLFENKYTKKSTSLILHRGHLFGELGVLTTQPRLATAIASGNVSLFFINGDEFKLHVSNKIEFQQLLASLQQVYEIPMKGLVEQYVGDVKGVGSAITNIYKMDDGRSIISTRLINQAIFMMTVTNVHEKQKFQYVKNSDRIELYTANRYLVEITAYGLWDDLPDMCRVLLENRTIEDGLLEIFLLTGELKLTKKQEVGIQSEIICQCMSVTKNQLQQLIDKGVRKLNLLSLATGASSACGGCKYKIVEMLSAAIWQPATIKKVTEHNHYVNSYVIEPSNTSFRSWLPGQHIIIQVKIGNNFIERPYVISSTSHDKRLRITIENEENGLFTTWLQETAPNEFPISVTEPQGNFVLTVDEDSAALCLANGIGITPFISFAKYVSAAQSKKRLHINYFAPTTNDFLFVEEFNQITSQSPNVTITYRATKNDASVTEDIERMLLSLGSKPEVYLCGSPQFLQLVLAALNTLKYDKNKIHIEEFVHAGG